VQLCGGGGSLAEEDRCGLCRDPNRDGSVVCVVEQPGDVLAFERTGQFRGRYHVLGGALSPLDGTNPEQLRIQALLDRLRRGAANDVGAASVADAAASAPAIPETILATNPHV